MLRIIRHSCNQEAFYQITANMRTSKFHGITAPVQESFHRRQQPLFDKWSKVLQRAVDVVYI
jgi:hypothetical protein